MSVVDQLPAPAAGAPAAGARTHCPYCALQCAQTLSTGDDGTVTATARQFPTNKGGMCQKGWTSPTLLRSTERLTTPLVRDAAGGLQPASWGEALELVATTLARLRHEHGPQSVAVFGGGGLTNEKAYALGKFARTVLATPNIDYNGRFCMASAAAGANRTLGLDRGLPFPLEDLGGAQAIMLLGSNLAETMPPSVQHLARTRAAGGVIVVDPRRSATAELAADGQGVHVQPVPGTDLAFLLGVAHIVLAEDLADTDYLESRTSGLDDMRRSLALWWPERTEQVTGVPVATLRRVAFLLAGASPSRGGTGAYILTGRGVEQSTQGTDTVTAAITLALLLGLPGRVGSGYGAITGQGNGQGGREHGQKADQLPGYRSIEDDAARAHVAGVWGVDPADLPRTGMPAIRLLQSLGTPDGPRALLVHGSNVLVSAPDADSVRRRLRDLELLVVCDFLPSETALAADVVLPVTQWAEEEGTMTSLEGRVIRRRRVVHPPPGVRSELDILADLAQRLGSPVHFDTDPALVFDELARASAGGRADYAGLSHARLDTEEPLFWPVPSADHPGTPRMFLDRFPMPQGRARLIPVDHRGPSDDLRADAPVFLITGRLLAHYQSGAQTRRVPELVRTAPSPYVEIHPLLAERYGIADDDLVQLETGRGRGVVRARLTESIRTDTVFLPFHWSGTSSANRLTTDAVDPISGMPEFKVCAVAVSRWAGSPDVLLDQNLLGSS
ncbi:molybdopterin oxidoreductase family protein [Cellulomonas sp. McL0617]|uniref:molybdopterin oxidoreductase family protein n=1 Tax=Cellulomonas sp. McL0617 TaxID=3415675 RepID=UPI003CFA4ADA